MIERMGKKEQVEGRQKSDTARGRDAEKLTP